MVIDLLEKWNIEQINSDEGRRYQLGEQSFPSVSTILSALSDKTYLNEWKARVGYQQASFASKQATTYGTYFHSTLEKFLLEGIEPTAPQMRAETQEIIALFKKANTKVRAVELPLFSPVLETAGMVDCIAEFLDIPVVIDFKTFGKRLYDETIKRYKLQASFYAIMANEMYNLNIKNILILAKKPHCPLIRIYDKVDEIGVMDTIKRYKELQIA